MPVPASLRRFAVALAVALTPGFAAAADPPASKVSPEVGREYAKPHDTIDIGGRKLNLFCMGSGKHTVLFESGGSDWSDTWALVQPVVAKGARACTYDRAGLGHSDPSPFPRTPAQIVEDMHALIAAAKLQRPLVLVGHSLGGFNAKLYAAVYPEDIAALVLVDPAEERSDDRTRPLLRQRFSPSIAARAELLDQSFYTWLSERYRRCVELVRQGPLDPATQDYRRCTDPVRRELGPEIAAERVRLQVGATYQLAQASEILNSVYGDPRGNAVYAGLFRPGVFGTKPLIVLTHGLYDPTDPIDAAGQAAGIALHEETARLSRRGRHRVIPGTPHNIQLAAPESIVTAISEVLADLDGAPAPKPGRRR